MNIFLYVIIFAIGALFGSFYTLAVYRIPLKQDIIHTHSYCPNCGHKLGFLELIPILSYIFSGGKCHNCKQRINIRYFIIEILSGICFVTIAKGMNVHIENIDINVAINLIFWVLYITLIFLVSGTDKVNRKIEKPLLKYGIIISIIYILYQYISLKLNVVQYIIYEILAIILIVANKTKNSYTFNVLAFVLIMCIFTGNLCTIFTIITTLIAIGLFEILKKLKYKKQNTKIQTSNVSMGFYLGTINLITCIIAVMLV